MGAWYGSMATSDLCQPLIAAMPPLATYIETHLGDSAIMQREPSALRNGSAGHELPSGRLAVRGPDGRTAFGSRAGSGAEDSLPVAAGERLAGHAVAAAGGPLGAISDGTPIACSQSVNCPIRSRPENPIIRPGRALPRNSSVNSV